MMKKPLPNDYDISGKNMLDMSVEQETENFKLFKAEFVISATKNIIVAILKYEDKQIFHMKDGIFILEIEEGDECQYFYSHDLNELCE